MPKLKFSFYKGFENVTNKLPERRKESFLSSPENMKYIDEAKAKGHSYKKGVNVNYLFNYKESTNRIFITEFKRRY